MNKDSVSRNQAIREYLKRHGHASVHELATAFFFSEATIRRILTELERSGQIQRTHGGAIYGPSSINERSIFARSSRNLSDKKRVAKAARKHLPPFSSYTSIFFDNSSTGLILFDRRNVQGKRVFTHGIKLLIDSTSKNDFSLFRMGGEVNKSALGTGGIEVLKERKELTFDLCIISCHGFTTECSYDTSSDTALIKKEALCRSRFKRLISDNTKYGKTSTFKTANRCEYDAVISNVTDDELMLLRRAGIKAYNK